MMMLIKQTLAILVLAITAQGASDANIESLSGLDREFMEDVTVTKKMEYLVDQLTNVLQKAAVDEVVNAEILRQKPDVKENINQILRSLDLDRSDWIPFCEDESNSITARDKSGHYKAGPKGYVRNVAYEHPGLFVVKILEWSSDAKSPIHSHGGS